MLDEAVIDRNIRYTPVMDGLTSPGYFQWYFEPITHHKVLSTPSTAMEKFQLHADLHAFSSWTLAQCWKDRSDHSVC